VFEITKTASGYATTRTTLVSFNGTDGGPGAGLIDASGNLFGASGGGAYGDGMVFEIIKTASGYASTATTLVNFNGTDGAYPSGLIADASGNLFGTTSSGGAYGDGTVFEITGSGFVTNLPFSSLRAALVVSRGPHAGFVLDARFGLRASSNGIDPASQLVTLQVGPYAALIPAGSFRQLAAGRKLSVYAGLTTVHAKRLPSTGATAAAQ
jgi:uncharacterized repeat protein (TIGR03803 family)